MTEEQPTLDDCVVELHHIARQLEAQLGHGTLSAALRDVADKLSDLTKVDYGFSRTH